jgi:hypothetical protein
MWIPFVVPPAVVLIAVMQTEAGLFRPRDASRQATIGGAS